jgi:hypothetical protein
MNIIKTINYNEKQISAMVVQNTSPAYLWLGFQKDSTNKCVLKKCSVNDPSQVFYSLSLDVDEITALHFVTPRVYTAVSDDIYFAYYRTHNTPISSEVKVLIPSGITESAIAIKNNGNTLFFLLPGEGSTNAKILVFSSTLVLQETIELTDIHNVRSFTIDSEGIIWCTTYEENSRLIKVYNDGGYTFEVINLFQ